MSADIKLKMWSRLCYIQYNKNMQTALENTSFLDDATIDKHLMAATMIGSVSERSASEA